MDQKNRIIPQGKECKFFVDIEGFDMEAGEFRVELIYGYRRTIVTILKEQMQQDAEGRFFFIFDTDAVVGIVTARCTWRVADDDCPDDYREQADEQPLCFVAATPCPQFACCPACTEEHPVTYTPTEQSDIADHYQYLADHYGNRFVTSDDLYLLVLKPGYVPDGE